MKPYCAFVRDPDCAYVDAFTLDWASFNNSCVFAPFSLLTRIMAKTQSDKATITAIVPTFPQQSWFPMMLRLLIAEPVLLPQEPHIFLPWNPTALHPLHHTLKLISVTLSGDTFKQKDFFQRLPTRSSSQLQNPHKLVMQHSSGPTSRFVLKGRLIPIIPLKQS